MNERKLDFSPIIALPQQRRDFIKEKVREHKDRLQTRLTPVQRLDIKYKIEIMQGLLSGSTIDTQILADKIMRKGYDAFNPDVFFNACDFVNDLAQTGGANIVVDRGLPKVTGNN